MRRLIALVWNWLFPPEIVTPPIQPHPLTPSATGISSGHPSTERGNQTEPLFVDASLLGMKREIGLVWREYPRVVEIYAVLPGIDLDDAEWIWNACNFGDRVWALIVLNDVARALIGGVPITEIRERGVATMMQPAVWERK